jgi:hypothetical protein
VQHEATAVSLKTAVSFKLSVRQRVSWAIGSPFRAVGFVIFTAAICWLSFVSIGLAAVIVIVIMVLLGHWVPFVLAGRSRLGATSYGLYDHVRFHKRQFPWPRIVRIQVVSSSASVHGLVADVINESTGNIHGEFLRSSWRPTREEAQDLLLQLENAGWSPCPHGSNAELAPQSSSELPSTGERSHS